MSVLARLTRRLCVVQDVDHSVERHWGRFDEGWWGRPVTDPSSPLRPGRHPGGRSCLVLLAFWLAGTALSVWAGVSAIHDESAPPHVDRPARQITSTSGTVGW